MFGWLIWRKNSLPGTSEPSLFKGGLPGDSTKEVSWKFAKPMASHLATHLGDGGCPYWWVFLGRTRWRGHPNLAVFVSYFLRVGFWANFLILFGEHEMYVVTWYFGCSTLFPCFFLHLWRFAMFLLQQRLPFAKDVVYIVQDSINWKWHGRSDIQHGDGACHVVRTFWLREERWIDVVDVVVKFPSWVDWYMIASDKVDQMVKEIILQYPLCALLNST